MKLRSGVVGIVVIAGVLYFTDAGTVAWSKIRGLSDNCYGALARTAPSVANPVCGAVVRGVDGLERAGRDVKGTIAGWQQRVFGADSFGPLGDLTQGLRARTAGLTSSKEHLMQMISRGPRFANSDSALLQLRQAVDSFEIGQQYLNSPGQTGQAVQWLRNGAAQPNGFGFMSQMTLGNLYLQGGQGVTANPSLGKAYLQQAKDSLATLSTSQSPQAQQLLQTLPASPQTLQQQIDKAIQSAKK